MDLKEEEEEKEELRSPEEAGVNQKFQNLSWF
jgi:hypothetical protein